MKYIPGHSFTVKVPGKIRSFSVTSVRTPPATSYGQFRAGRTYTLNRIKPIEDGLEYSFSSPLIKEDQLIREVITETFPSASDADKKIDSLTY